MTELRALWPKIAPWRPKLRRPNTTSSSGVLDIESPKIRTDHATAVQIDRPTPVS
jgi:hypothetical protein